MESSFAGPERRQNKMFITRNTEYYIRDSVCLAVKDRRTATWLDGHLAVGSRLSGGVRVLENGEAIPVLETPLIGDALYLCGAEQELVTSALCGVERAELEVVRMHPS